MLLKLQFPLISKATLRKLIVFSMSVAMVSMSFATSANNAIDLTTLPALPEATANNSVAKVSTENGDYLVSFMGLGSGKDYPDVHNKVWSLKLGEQNWRASTPVPSTISPVGRLASTAVGIGAYAYVFGGYTVDKDHNEISSPDVYRFDVEKNSYKKLTPMPVPVDDSVALVYQNRFIYLISGWHNDGNVNLVQVYDIQTDSWQQASPFLGTSVFGQAGAISGNVMVICDGVGVVPHANKRRSFKGVAQCFKGEINPKTPYKVDWRVLKHPTGKARYRMAAGTYNKSMYFVGGSENPYNFNGIGYNGVPSTASNNIWRFDVNTNGWQMYESKEATMDHRGLIIWGDIGLTIGGMNSKQQVLNKIITHKLAK